LRFGRLTLLLIVLAVPASSGSDTADVLVLRAGPTAPYEPARQSLLDALPEGTHARTVELEREGRDEIAQQIAESRPSVIVTLGSDATRWALEHTKRVPIVFAMVLQPVESGFIRSFERPGGRVTGAALDVDPEVPLRTLQDLLSARRVGVLYDPAETGALSEARVQVDGSLDALWSVPDRTVFGHGGVKQVLLHTLEHKIPFMGLSEQYVRAGALLALSNSLPENGRQAAARVSRVLASEPAGRIPVARPESLEVVYNEHVARRLGVELPASARGVAP